QSTSQVSGHCGPAYYGVRLTQLTGLVVTPSGNDVLLEWTPQAGAPGYNVWTVTDVADLDLARITSRPPAVGVVGCSWPNPALNGSCTDFGGMLRGSPGMLF